jgi:hypothetical protein
MCTLGSGLFVLCDGSLPSALVLGIRQGLSWLTSWACTNIGAALVSTEEGSSLLGVSWRLPHHRNVFVIRYETSK